VGGSRATLRFTRHESRTHCDVLSVTGEELRISIEI